MKFAKLIIAIVICFFGLTASSFAQTAEQQTAEKTSLTKHKLKVKGATCKTDLGMIVTNVKKLEGVKNCVVAKRGVTSTLEVEYLQDQVDFKKIKATIENTGTCEDPNERRYKVKL